MCMKDGSCGCGCPQKKLARRSSARSAGTRLARDVREDQVSYRFATAAALVRQERMTGPQARQAVQEASAIVDSRMRRGDSPASAARYVASLPTTRSSYPPPARDNGPPSGVRPMVRKRGQRRAVEDFVSHVVAAREAGAGTTEHRREMQAAGAVWATLRRGERRLARSLVESAPLRDAQHRFARDPQRKAKTSASLKPASRGARWNGRKRSEAGMMKVSAKGNPYRVCPRGTRIQTLIFPLTQFTEKKASKWARDHGFRIQKIDITSQSIRIRQQPVELFTKGSFRTITLPSRTGTIRAVIGCPRFAIIAGGRRAERREERRQQPARRQAGRRLRRAA